MRDHIILCGLGAVGIKILEHLVMFNKQVIVIDIKENNDYINTARDMKVPVIHGDVRRQNTLEKANVSQAQSLIAATDNDLANLEAALNARAQNPDIRVVLRVFDSGFADKIRDGFQFGTAFSTQGISAPAFAMAAIDPSVIGSFFIGENLMLNVQLTIQENSMLDGMDSDEFIDKGAYAILIHEDLNTGKKKINPSDPVCLKSGDRLVVATPHCDLAALHTLNKPLNA